MKKWQVIFIILGGVLITLGAYTKPNGENIDGMTQQHGRRRLDSIMTEWSVSLGVKCSYCHARHADTNQPGLNYDSEKKPEKRTARNMYRMTSYLNANYFNFANSTEPDTIHVVICYTCHRGRPKPDGAFVINQLDSLQRSLRKK